MNRPDLLSGHLKKRDGDPIFAEPWHAQASAMADLLIAAGTISLAQWAETLGSEIVEATAAGNPDDAETFYRAVLSSLEHLLAAGQNVSQAELARRREEWRHAYESTPHGLPVELRIGRDKADSGDAH